MVFISKEEIKQSIKKIDFSTRDLFFSEGDKRVENTIFLSHCHDDKELTKELILFLDQQSDTKVYVDWNDSAMPRVTNVDTARLIKARIQQMNLFYILATNRALLSRWVPWEIGIAEAIKENEKIAIIPVVENDESFIGSEYLGLYQSISYSDKREIGVWKPGASTGMKYKNWVKPDLWK